MVALMNTFAIYEQFRTVLGEEGAKGFAQTLGTMLDEARNAATKEDIRILRESVSTDVSRLEAAMIHLAQAQDRTESQVKELTQAQTRTESQVKELAQAQARTESQVKELTQAQARTESQVKELAQAQVRTETQVKELTQAQARTESQVKELAQAQARTETRVGELAQAQGRTEARVEELAVNMSSFATILNQLVIRSDRHEGSLLELRFRDRLPAYLGRFLRRGRVIQASDLLEQIEPTLAEAAVDDFLRADVVATGMVEGKTTYLVGEVSYTVDADDVMRAARRAACLVKAGLPAIPLVACEKISPQTTAYAHQEGVRVWVDGSLLDA
jgi:DNA repair exonuclease SbcCD ATPase subunit